MSSRLRGFVKGFPGVYRAYRIVRQGVDAFQARRLFKNYKDYRRALYAKGEGDIVLHTRDGLQLTIRQNLFDARIVREIFLARPYIRHMNLPTEPVVVDVGGYIGDFALYAARYLNASRVVVYEPTVENFRLLKQNISINGLDGRITAVNKAVSDCHEIALNVQIKDSEEVHVSGYWYEDGETRRIPSVTLPDLLDSHHLTRVDLLKVDCEGCEYDVFQGVGDEVLDCIHNIVFEYHQVDGHVEKLKAVLDRLKSAGYSVRLEEPIAYACRE